MWDIVCLSQYLDEFNDIIDEKNFKVIYVWFFVVKNTYL